MKRKLWPWILTAIVATLVSIGTALAQVGDPGSYPPGTRTNDFGFDVGWLGLLGLFGLLGLRRRHERDDRHHHPERRGAPA